jgi:serine/threonine-protein phosphatase 5
VVDSDYDGPHLQGPITLDFVVQMIEHFKKQKRLHKKYAASSSIALCRRK